MPTGNSNPESDAAAARASAAHRAGRTPPLFIRMASGLNLWARVDRQAERDALVHRLTSLDAQLKELSDERQAIVDALAGLRDELYPPVPWSHGRRPPDIDCAPLPPAPDGARALTGRALRATCLTILRRHGPTSLRDLHGLLHRYGYLIAAPRTVTALSDAMAYEVERGRARRVSRGTYGAAAEAAPRRREPAAPLPDAPDPWLPHQPTPLDPDLDQDPPSWTHRRAG